ncbi:MAG: DUF5716 family protein [Treponema sp.]|jgi:hypothetical protein|nr:DUF5716 family protein [Treponema sp.]
MPNSGVFTVLPENFFSPLARGNREHYAALLVLYYRLFQENTQGPERELVIRTFTEYLVLHRNSLAEEEEEPAAESGADSLEENPNSTGASDTSNGGGFVADIENSDTAVLNPSPSDSTESPLLDFGENDNTGKRRAGNASSKSAGVSISNDRSLALKFLRRLVGSGWLTEETLGDYTRLINITPWGRPFFESLVRVDEGLKTEYESHVVNIYSSLCGDAVKENGHYAVLHANEETQLLIDSLKVLSQSIKGYYDRLNTGAISAEVSDILRQHYDEYREDILDAAYKRLKTSDNLSRYRPKIFRKVTELLLDEKWLNESSRKLARIRQSDTKECREKLKTMLEDIRDTLRAVDPLQDEIDRRNAQYSRSSTERIKALLEPDTTIAGKLGILVKAIYGGDEELSAVFAHSIFRIRHFAAESLYRRYRRETAEFKPVSSPVDEEALARTEALFLERMQRQLSLKKISAWLDEQGGRERILSSVDLVKDEKSFIRFVYTLLYGDSRLQFNYDIEDMPAAMDFSDDMDIAVNESAAVALNGNSISVSSGGYVIPGVRLRRKNEQRY